jgi:hypothetical protein
MYSKSYQAPCAGKARPNGSEADQDYEKRAKVATPAGYFAVNSYCAAGKHGLNPAQPDVEIDAMNDEGMGKKPAPTALPGVDKVRKPVKSAYNFGTTGVSNAAGI